jgi:tetratricopeptide (TPR) repeat protein
VQTLRIPFVRRVQIDSRHRSDPDRNERDDLIRVAPVCGVIAHHRRGEVEEALRLCLEVVRRRPDMPAALVQQALLQRALGRLPPAVEALRRVVVLTPEDTGAVALLASYLNESGGADEAARLVAPYASREDAPLDLLLAQGVSLAQLGLHGKACGMLNVLGYFEGVVAFAERAIADGFVRPEHRGLLISAHEPAALLDALLRWEPPHVEKWITRSTS